jgi:hypothetical protein
MPIVGSRVMRYATLVHRFAMNATASASALLWPSTLSALAAKASASALMCGMRAASSLASRTMPACTTRSWLPRASRPACIARPPKKVTGQGKSRCHFADAAWCAR